MISRQDLDSFFNKYFATQEDNIPQMLWKLTQNPSRHLIPPLCTKTGKFTDDRMLRIAGNLIGFSYLRTYATDKNLYILRCVVINDKVVSLSVGAKDGVDWVDKDTEYFFMSNPYNNGVVIQCLTNDTEQCQVTYKEAQKQLVQAGNDYVDRKEQEAYATYRDIKNYMQAEMRQASNNILL